jgi:hypothetical protein
MKCLRLLMIAALCLTAGVARGEVYGYDEPAADAVTPHADEVIVGDEGVPAGAPMMDHYGYAPSWSGGCCERVASPADHIWDDYCCERHGVWGCWNHGCCERSFGCGGPFHKDCCEGGGCLSRLHLPHLHLPRLSCSQKCCSPKGCSQKCCSQKCAPKCAPKCATKCSSKCGHGHCLANFRLFRGCGLLHGGKCGKCSKSAVVVEGPAAQEMDEVPMPNMPGDEPPPPPMPDGRAA